MRCGEKLSHNYLAAIVTIINEKRKRVIVCLKCKEILDKKGKYTEKYNNYRIESEKINLERKKSALKSVNIPTFEEWLKTQPLTPDEIELFKKYKASTTEDLKGQDKIHRQMKNLKAKETKGQTETTSKNATKQ
jgi:DNA-binding protein